MAEKGKKKKGGRQRKIHKNPKLEAQRALDRCKDMDYQCVQNWVAGRGVAGQVAQNTCALCTIGLASAARMGVAAGPTTMQACNACGVAMVVAVGAQGAALVKDCCRD